MADPQNSGRNDASASAAGNEFSLSRWSRLKRSATSDNGVTSIIAENNGQAQRVGSIAEDAASKPLVATSTTGNVPNAQSSPNAEPDLPSLADVGLDKDFTPFMQAKVPEVLRRQALKTLFKDAHFNTMDGLDIYIDDYTQFEPISAEDLEKLSAWQSIKNPLQQVVTPGGYAVDVKSEEGKAVLAAREALERGEIAPETATPNVANVDNDTDAAAIASETSPQPAIGANAPVSVDSAHPRYGKRVGDFKIEIEPLAAPISSTASDAFDPR